MIDREPVKRRRVWQHLAINCESDSQITAKSTLDDRLKKVICTKIWEGYVVHQMNGKTAPTSVCGVEANETEHFIMRVNRPETSSFGGGFSLPAKAVLPRMWRPNCCFPWPSRPQSMQILIWRASPFLPKQCCRDIRGSTAASPCRVSHTVCKSCMPSPGKAYKGSESSDEFADIGKWSGGPNLQLCRNASHFPTLVWLLLLGVPEIGGRRVTSSQTEKASLSLDGGRNGLRGSSWEPSKLGFLSHLPHQDHG
jgi:hypothetical protein